jgi:hypothetical protein
VIPFLAAAFLSSGTTVHSTTVTDFNLGTGTAVAANDILAAHLYTVATAKYVNFILGCNQ